jgi:hypothetical protein
MLLLWAIESAAADLSQATLSRRLPALSQPQPKCLVTCVVSSSSDAAQLIGPTPEQVYAQLFSSLPTGPPPFFISRSETRSLFQSSLPRKAICFPAAQLNVKKIHV